MEDDRNSRQPEWKTTKMENDQYGRRKNGRHQKWNTIKREDNQNKKRPEG